MSEFASNCCPSCGHVMLGPKGKPNDLVASMMEIYPEIPRLLFVCNRHGLWFNQLDDLFPVYWQNNKCKDCE